MEETSFFSNDGVQVTNARFVVDGQTYAMRNITSVKTMVIPPKRFWIYLIGFIGAMMTLSGIKEINSVFFFGLLLLAGAFAMWRAAKTSYIVALSTSGGEVKALTSHQKDYAGQVVAALNAAIIQRG